MQTVNLYKYEENFGTIVTPTQRDKKDTPDSYRLIADEGMILTNGELEAFCIDTKRPDSWNEIENPNKDEEVHSWQNLS